VGHEGWLGGLRGKPRGLRRSPPPGLHVKNTLLAMIMQQSGFAERLLVVIAGCCVTARADNDVPDVCLHGQLEVTRNNVLISSV